MNYTELVTFIEDITENSFTTAQVNMFIDQAEQKIYNTVEFPDLRKNSTGTLTLDNKYWSVPTDFLYVYSLAVVDGSGAYVYLINKDVNFMREAYPVATATGLPKYYSFFDADSILLGPTPDTGYAVELHYGYYPESIVTATNTWLGDEFDSALLNGSLLEALRFMKGEQDIMTVYENFYVQSLKLLKQLGEGKLRGDAYRSGQSRLDIGNIHPRPPRVRANPNAGGQ
jgi:hypothetical protein